MEAHDNVPLLETPLCRKHVELGAKMAPFGGWLMPIQYSGILAEHAHTRAAVSVFDICHMGEFMLEADPAASGLDRIVTQNITGMSAGTCRYGFMLNERGGIVDDLIVYRLAERSWMLVVNAATIGGDAAHIRGHLDAGARFTDVSAQTGKLDIQGPQSLEVVKMIFGPGVDRLAYYTFAEFSWQGSKCIVSRTGYTGELGYEVYIPADRVGELWDAVLTDPRAKPAGLGARDTLRLEMAYPLYGQDIDTGRTPVAAGLERFVELNKDFIGRGTVLRERERGGKERLVCFKADSRRSPRHGSAIFAAEKRIGTVTSGSFSPSLSVGIGMGYVEGNPAPGTALEVREGNAQIAVTVVKKPFYRKAA